jgi:DNA-binding LytR/AlgR family response regulator
MNQKIPEYLVEKGNIVRLILYTALFALIFINIYQPFGSSEWFKVTDIMYFLFSSLVILAGVLIVVVSRIIMYHYAKEKNVFIWQYILWVLAEIVAMATFYTLFEKIVLHDARDLMDMIRESTINTGLVLLLPYSTIWLYFSWIENKKKLDILSRDDEIKEVGGKGMFNFFDEKKELRLSVLADQVVWLEAADNYVKIHYLNKGKIATFMIRNALKVMEASFANTSLVRCNRSVMVNFDKVNVLRKEKEGIFLGLDLENVPDIPVSKTYADRVLVHFSNYSI